MGIKEFHIVTGNSKTSIKHTPKAMWVNWLSCEVKKTLAVWICRVSLLYQSGFHVCFPSLSSDLHPAATGQDSVLDRARNCRERSSLAVCPRGKTNPYLEISLLCPFFIRPHWPKPHHQAWLKPCSIAMFGARLCFVSVFIYTQVLCLCLHTAADCLRLATGAHRFSHDYIQGFDQISSYKVYE